MIADFPIDSGYEKAKELLRQCKENGTTLDGIICATDSIAIGVMQYLKELCIRVPDEIMVTGHGDSVLSDVVAPTLTTIRYSYEETGSLAATMLLELLENKESAVREIKMGYFIVEKESTEEIGKQFDIWTED